MCEKTAELGELVTESCHMMQAKGTRISSGLEEQSRGSTVWMRSRIGSRRSAVSQNMRIHTPALQFSPSSPEQGELNTAQCQGWLAAL